MRALGTQLLKGKGLARLVSKACPGRRVSKEMIQAIASYHRQDIKDHLAIARRTQLLELPTTAFHLLIVLLNFGTFFIMTHNPRGVELTICRNQDDMVCLLFPLIPELNHTGIQRHRTFAPHMLHTAYQRYALRGP